MTRSAVWMLAILLFLLLVGCQHAESMDRVIMDSASILQIDTLENYLVANVGISAFDGVVFCAYEPLDAAQGVDGKIYLWVLCQEYYLEHEALDRGSGVSLPVALQIQDQNDRYEITGYWIPRDGTYFGPDVRAAFPENTWAQIMPRSLEEIEQYNQRANRLELETERKAGTSFGY